MLRVKVRSVPTSSKIVVLITCGSRSEARKIARVLVSRRLAACVNIVSAPIESIYRWKEKVESAREILLVAKTSRARFAALCDAVLKLHRYDVPEIIALPIVVGSADYLSWMDDCL